MSELEKRAGPIKKAYSKPLLTRIALRPEEAVLGTCKTSLISGPAQATCAVPPACSGSGS